MQPLHDFGTVRKKSIVKINEYDELQITPSVRLAVGSRKLLGLYPEKGRCHRSKFGSRGSPGCSY